MAKTRSQQSWLNQADNGPLFSPISYAFLLSSVPRIDEGSYSCFCWYGDTALVTAAHTAVVVATVVVFRGQSISQWVTLLFCFGHCAVVPGWRPTKVTVASTTAAAAAATTIIVVPVANDWAGIIGNRHLSSSGDRPSINAPVLFEINLGVGARATEPARACWCDNQYNEIRRSVRRRGEHWQFKRTVIFDGKRMLCVEVIVKSEHRAAVLRLRWRQLFG